MRTEGTGARGSNTSAGTVVPLSTCTTTAGGAWVVEGAVSPGRVDGGVVATVVVVTTLPVELSGFSVE